MLIQPKSTSYFYYAGITAFALLCIAISIFSFWLKLLLVFFILAFVSIDCHRREKNRLQAFKFFAEKMPYWLLRHTAGSYPAVLLSQHTYQSRYFICLFWRYLNVPTLQSMPKRPAALLCRWHYDAETWRALQVLITTHPSTQTI